MQDCRELGCTVLFAPLKTSFILLVANFSLNKEKQSFLPLKTILLHFLLFILCYLLQLLNYLF